MCNLYTTLSGEEIVQYFRREHVGDGGSGFELDAPQEPYKPIIGPLGQGPFVVGKDTAIVRGHRDVVVGQWGLIPSASPKREPSTPDGSRRLSTNNCRREGMAKSYAFGPSWRAGRRCLIPTWSYIEPYWPPGAKKSIRWEFFRADGRPWALAGLWNDWRDHSTGEIVHSFTMITQTCDGHPLLSLMHKPVLGVDGQPIENQDKRTVVPIWEGDWDTWLNGSAEEAEALIVVPALEVFRHQAQDTAERLQLPAFLRRG